MMITFKEFLNETAVRKHKFETIGDLDKIAEIIKTQCSNALASFKEEHVLYRGWRSKKYAGIYDPSTGIRKSQNTTNFYTSLLKTNPANKAWPDRSRSFICTKFIDTAFNFSDDGSSNGTVTAVFPFDGVKIAATPTEDIWYIELGEINNLEITLPKLNDIIEYIGKHTEFGVVKEYIKLNKWVDSVSDEALAEAFFGCFTQYSDAQRALDAQGIAQLRDVFKKAYSYEALGCELVDTAAQISYEDAECWFSGKCVLVPYAQLIELTGKL